MRLYLLRHASAADVAPSDAERPLTKQGEDEARIAGTALKKLGAAPAVVLSSPLLRARQTAEIAALALQFTGPIQTLDELLNGIATAALLKALQPHHQAQEILLVGHMPGLAEHLGVLVSAALKDPDGLALGKGGVACVQLLQLRPGSGQLRWLMRQDQLCQLLE